jgi:hypothetical protein
MSLMGPLFGLQLLQLSPESPFKLGNGWCWGKYKRPPKERQWPKISETRLAKTTALPLLAKGTKSPANKNTRDNTADIGRIYIKGYLYRILYPKISKKDSSYPFSEQDILRI